MVESYGEWTKKRGGGETTTKRRSQDPQHRKPAHQGCNVMSVRFQRGIIVIEVYKDADDEGRNSNKQHLKQLFQNKDRFIRVFI